MRSIGILLSEVFYHQNFTKGNLYFYFPKRETYKKEYFTFLVLQWDLTENIIILLKEVLSTF